MLNENYILKQIKKKDLEAFNLLFYEFNRPLTLFAQQYVFDIQAGEDIVQENFMHFWENANRIEIRTSLKSYFYQSVRNRCLNYLRDKSIHDKHNLLYIESLIGSDDNEIFSDQSIKESLVKAIDQLPSEMAKIIRLKYLERMKIAEVSSMLNISNNTIKTQLSRGKEKLKKLMNEMANFNII